MRGRWALAFLGLVFLMLVGGCSNSASDQAREDKTRDDVARATEKTREEAAKAAEQAKPALQEAGRQIGKAAAVAADEAQAAAEGVKEGWNRAKNSSSTPINVNIASEADLKTLPGIGHMDAMHIIEARPYADKHELVSKGAISEAEYGRIRTLITSK